MSEIHLNDLTKIYNDQIVEKKKDDTYLEPDMKKRQANNEKARKDMQKMGTSMKNPHFESLDPVGKEDGDVNNDGKKDTTDKYLLKRRKAIGKAIAKSSQKKMSESISDWRQELAEIMTDDIDSKPIKEKKVSNKVTINPKLGEAVEELGGEILEMTEVDEATYGSSNKPAPTDKRLTVTNADKAGNTPAYQKMKAGDKSYKAADHMKEGDGDPCWDSHKQVGMKKKGGKMVPNCVPKNEEVEVEEGMKPLPKNKMFRKAGNLGRDVVSPSVTDDQRQKAYDRSKKIVKTLNKANEEIEVSEDMETPKGQQIQKKQLELDRRKLRLRMQAAQKKQATAADTVVEKHECAHNMKGKDCPVHGKKDCSSMDEATEDSLRDRRMERGGVDGNNRYKSAPKNVAMGGGKKKPYDGMSALEKVKASIRAKHGQGAIMDTKKK